MIYVEGKIQTRKWQDKEGKDRYTTEIIVNEMKMIGGKARTENQDAEPPRKGKQDFPDGADDIDF